MAENIMGFTWLRVKINLEIHGCFGGTFSHSVQVILLAPVLFILLSK